MMESASDGSRQARRANVMQGEQDRHATRPAPPPSPIANDGIQGHQRRPTRFFRRDHRGLSQPSSPEISNDGIEGFRPPATSGTVVPGNFIWPPTVTGTTALANGRRMASRSKAAVPTHTIRRRRARRTEHPFRLRPRSAIEIFSAPTGPRNRPNVIVGNFIGVNRVGRGAGKRRERDPPHQRRRRRATSPQNNHDLPANGVPTAVLSRFLQHGNAMSSNNAITANGAMGIESLAPPESTPTMPADPRCWAERFAELSEHHLGPLPFAGGTSVLVAPHSTPSSFRSQSTSTPNTRQPTPAASAPKVRRWIGSGVRRTTKRIRADATVTITAATVSAAAGK
jgi:hypothetical protein